MQRNLLLLPTLEHYFFWEYVLNFLVLAVDDVFNTMPHYYINLFIGIRLQTEPLSAGVYDRHRT